MNWCCVRERNFAWRLIYRSLINSFIHPFIHWCCVRKQNFAWRLTYRSFIHSSIHSFIHPAIHPLLCHRTEFRLKVDIPFFIHSSTHPFIHVVVVCLMTGPWPLPKSSSPYNAIQCQYRLFSFKLSTSCLRLLLRLLAPYNFPSATSFRRQFLCKVLPFQLAFLRFILCRLLLSPMAMRSKLLHFSHDRSNQSNIGDRY